MRSAWWLEQIDEVFQTSPFYGDPEYPVENWVMGGIALGGAQTVMVAPYVTLARAHGYAADAAFWYHPNQRVEFRVSKGRIRAVPLRRGAAKYAAGKIGSRFIPYVGVALLMYDAWTLGTWIGEQLFE